jgi:membrane protein YqaA with SNARE-associated domain
MIWLRDILKGLYAWTLAIAGQAWAPWGLFGIAFAESSFFPIPPDVLLIAMGLSEEATARPGLCFWYALICSAGSVLGGCLGYAIGLYGGRPLAEKIFRKQRIETVERLYRKYDIWAVVIAGFTPIPYKVFTITTGLLRAGFWRFVIASAASRSARFFLVATLLYFLGPQVKEVLDTKFELATLVLVVIGIGGFAALKLLHRKPRPDAAAAQEASDAAPESGE